MTTQFGSAPFAVPKPPAFPQRNTQGTASTDTAPLALSNVTVHVRPAAVKVAVIAVPLAVHVGAVTGTVEATSTRMHDRREVPDPKSMLLCHCGGAPAPGSVPGGQLLSFRVRPVTDGLA